MGGVFVLELNYTAQLSDVDEHLDEHVEWLTRGYDAGVFLASGRKNPRDGGIIVAVGDDRVRIEKLAATDPFVVAGVCEYRITEFIATKTAPALADYAQQLPD